MSSNESTNGPIKFATNSFLSTSISNKLESNAQQTQSAISFSSSPFTIKPNESLLEKSTTSPFKTPDVELKSPEKTNQSPFSLSKPLFSNTNNTTIPSFNLNPLTQTSNTPTLLIKNSTDNKTSGSETTTSTTSSNLFKFGPSSVTSPTPNQSSITITKLSTNENTNNNESNRLLSNDSSESNILTTPFKFGASVSTILTPSTTSTTPNSFQSPLNNQSQQQSQSTLQPQTKPFSLFQSTLGKDAQSNDPFKSSNDPSDLNAKPSFSFSSNNSSTMPNFSLPNFALTPTPTPTQSTSFPSITNSTTNSTTSTALNQPSLPSFNTPVLQTNKPFGNLNSSDSLKPNSLFGFNISSSNQSLLSNTPITTNTNNNPSETSLNNLLQQPPKTISSFSFGSTVNNTAAPISFQSPPANTQTNQSSIFSSQAQNNSSFSFKASAPAFGSTTTSAVFNSNTAIDSATGANTFSSPFNSNTGFKFNETQTNTTSTFGSSSTNAFNFQ